MPAETHSHREAVSVETVLDCMATIIGLDPEGVGERSLDELGLEDDLAVLHLWDAVVDELGERSTGELEPLEPAPATLGELAVAFHEGLEP